MPGLERLASADIPEGEFPIRYVALATVLDARRRAEAVLGSNRR